MLPPTQRELLNVWERALEQDSFDRTLTLLSICGVSEPDELTVGEADRCLLNLREVIFGPEIRGVARCPQCGNALELSVNASSVLSEKTDTAAELGVGELGYDARFRIPRLKDLKALQAEEPEQWQRVLLRQCLSSLTCEGRAVAAEEVPEALMQSVAERMSEADKQADIEFVLQCVDCQHRWMERFDIASFLWSEIQAWAGRMLNEVHQLAAAYGWSEEKILELSPVRRHLYLNLATQ